MTTEQLKNWFKVNCPWFHPVPGTDNLICNVTVEIELDRLVDFINHQPVIMLIDDYHEGVIHGVFSSKEKAEGYARKLSEEIIGGRLTETREFTLDPPWRDQ